MISHAQYGKLMKTYRKTQNVTESACHAGMDRGTARKCIADGPPQGRRKPRDYRTREDPFTEVWKEAEELLEREPRMEATTLFEELQHRHPDRFPDGQLRSFQRQVSKWKAKKAPKAEVFFPQDHRPGERLQLDWFDARELGITVGGKSYKHLLCHVVLPCSNWESVTPCRSESFLSLKKGLQQALWLLGKAPLICQTDNSSTATHRLKKGRVERGFNEAYLSLLDHYGMKAETTNIRSPHENGDVESSHGHLKRYLRDQLAIRANYDFESETAYENFLSEACATRNQKRESAVCKELTSMGSLPGKPLPEFQERDCRVNKDGVVRIAKIGYSVPAQWVGKRLRAHIYEERIELFYGREEVATMERHFGDRGTYVNWRHLLEALQRKPGAFERYRYQEHFFPSLIWREAYDALGKRNYSAGRREREYLGLLALALEESKQVEVENHLKDLLESRSMGLDEVRRRMGAENPNDEGIQLKEMEPELNPYDALIREVA